jgi:DNA polymerase-1
MPELSRGAFDLSIPDPIFVETEQQARQWLEYMVHAGKRRGALGLDTETTGRNRLKDWVVLWSLSDGGYRLCLEAKWLELFKEPLLENPEINFDFSNAPFDAHMLANTGIDVSKAGRWHDTLNQSWLWNENNIGGHGLKENTELYFRRVTPHFEDVFGKIPKRKKNGPVIGTGDLIRAAMADPLRRQRAIDYSSMDAFNTTMLREHFDGLLSTVALSPYTQKTLRDHYYEVECPFTKVLWKMERHGFTVDGGYFNSIAPAMTAELNAIEREFAKEAQTSISLTSPKQLQWFFFEHLKRIPTKFTKGGQSGNKQPSTDEEVLEGWAGEGDRYAQLILRHRKISKILGTYVEGLSERIDHNSRIHTSLLQQGTVTGRLSSKEPNLQNIPRAAEDKYRIREAFVAGAFQKLMVADYEQLEMRLMAHFAEWQLPEEQQKMCNAIRQGIDLHCLTVHEMYNIPYEDVIAAKKAEKAVKSGKRDAPLTERELDLLLKRQLCKAAGFGIIYGIGGELLAANLTRDSGTYISPDEGKELIKKWLRVFPSVDEFIERTKRFVRHYGYVQTLLGRYRRFGDLGGMSRNDAARCERQAVNAIIQGTAADLARIAMINAAHDPELMELGATLLLQIHDELIWELPNDKEKMEKAKARAKYHMENVADLAVPTPVEIGFGDTWADAK